jgi:hypothetical protein
LFCFVLWYWVIEPSLMCVRQVFYHLSHTPRPFVLVHFEIGSCFLLRTAWTVVILSFNASCSSWDDRHTPSLLAFSVEMGSHKIFAWAGLEPRSSAS